MGATSVLNRNCYVQIQPATNDSVYRPRQPRRSPLWKCLRQHFGPFRDQYDRRYLPRYGPLRPVIIEVLEKFLACGDLQRGFARVRCPKCRLEYLLAFS